VQVFKEAKLLRARRQLATVTRAVRAGRARAKSQEAEKPVDGEALLQVLSAVGADLQLGQVPVNRPPWTPTTITPTSATRSLGWHGVTLI
jgi:hypothetical protein